MGIYSSDRGRAEVQGHARDLLDAWHVDHEHRHVTTSLGTTSVVVAGEGPPVLLLPGTSFSTVTWLDLVERLAARWRVHGVDLPGQPGLSGTDRPRHPRPAYGRWLREVVAALGAAPDGARPVVVAHSLGAIPAIAAATAGTRLGGMLLIAPAGIMRLSVTPSVLGPTLAWLARPTDPSAAQLLRVMLAPGSEPPDHLVTWMRLVGKHVRTSLAPPPVPPDTLVGARDLPVEVLAAAHDVFLPARRLVATARRRLPDAQARVVARAGHLLPVERPDAIVQRLDALTTPPGA